MPRQIEQVVNALMINAREAMPHGGTVRISARNVEFTDKDEPNPAGRALREDHYCRSRDRGPR